MDMNVNLDANTCINMNGVIVINRNITVNVHTNMVTSTYAKANMSSDTEMQV